MLFNHRINIILMLVVFSAVTIQTAFGQDSDTPTPTPTPSQQEKDLDEKIRILKKEKELAELKKDIRAAQPTPTSTPLSGEVTAAKDLKMEVNLRTYKAVRKISNQIACDIRTNLSTNTFIFYKPEVYTAWRNFKASDTAIKQQLKDMKIEYDAWRNDADEIGLLPNPIDIGNLRTTRDTSAEGSVAAISAALLGGTTVVRSLVDLLSMFRTNVEYSYSSVTVDENSLKAMISDALRRTTLDKANQCVVNNEKKVIEESNLTTHIYDPDIFYPLNNGKEEERIQYLIDELSKLKRAAEIEVAIYDIRAADITKFRKDIETAEKLISEFEEKILTRQEAERDLTLEIAKAKEGDEKAALVKNHKKLEAEIASLIRNKQKIESKLGAYQSELQKLESEMDLYYRVKIARYRQLNSDFGQFFTALNTKDETSKISPLMQYTKIESLNNILDSMDARWLEVRSVEAGGSNRVQTNLLRYFYKPDVSFSGGSIIEFSVSDKDGKVLISNTQGGYEKYRKASKILE